MYRTKRGRTSDEISVKVAWKMRLRFEIDTLMLFPCRLF